VARAPLLCDADDGPRRRRADGLACPVRLRTFQRSEAREALMVRRPADGSRRGAMPFAAARQSFHGCPLWARWLLYGCCFSRWTSQTATRADQLPMRNDDTRLAGVVLRCPSCDTAIIYNESAAAGRIWFVCQRCSLRWSIGDRRAADAPCKYRGFERRRQVHG
jgi:hypothetical protein